MVACEVEDSTFDYKARLDNLILIDSAGLRRRIAIALEHALPCTGRIKGATDSKQGPRPA
jgi:hypothetical protein